MNTYLSLNSFVIRVVGVGAHSYSQWTRVGYILDCSHIQRQTTIHTYCTWITHCTYLHCLDRMGNQQRLGAKTKNFFKLYVFLSDYHYMGDSLKVKIIQRNFKLQMNTRKKAI